MADFCKQCSVELGAPAGWTDMPVLRDPDRTLVTVCEGCQDGAVTTLMNAIGECVGLVDGEPCASGHTRWPKGRL